MSDTIHMPHALPEGFQPTRPGGLTDAEAARRPANAVSVHPGKSVWQIIAGNLFTPFNLLNISLAVCLALVGSWRNMLFMGVVVSNTFIGTLQELRARRTIQRLTLLNAPQAHVLRDSTERTCRPEDLVQDDLVILRAGDQVVADALVVDGSGAANEALLTGESDAIRKRPGDWLLSGSYLTEGRITAQLIRVGDESYAASLTHSAREIKRPKSALMTEMNRLIRFISIVLVPLGLLLFVKDYFFASSALQDAVPASVAAMIGMIPEGLMLLTSVAMAVGVVRLGRRQTLVQELYGIETLARADVLCLDKTGTLTTGRMTVEALVPADGSEESLKTALARFLGAMDERSATLDALRRAVAPDKEAPIAILPFSSARKMSAASFSDGTTLILGAPDFVLSPEQLSALNRQIEPYAADGYRVLLLAQAAGCVSETEAPVAGQVLGLCVLSDEIRPAAGETLRYFQEQHVTVKIISGDDPRTAAAIARRVGLSGEAVDASALDESQLDSACEQYAIFGRVTPVQKKCLVEALKQRGHSVAMTGDGVNDIPALKAADCSIAMPGGSDAAKQVAQLTLLDGNFASMPLVVSEGRRVVGNITRAASLFLVKTLYSFALTLLVLFLPVDYPFQPIQLTLVSSLTVGIPSFFLALAPNHARMTGNFLQTVLLKAIPGAAAVTFCALASMFCRKLGWDEADCSTLATLSAGIVGLLMLLSVCQPLTRQRMLLCGVMTAAFTGAVLLFGQAFLLTRLSPCHTAALLALIPAAAGVMALVTWGMKRYLTGMCD
ncbi:MAG: HAD-IC family P-type ATPase [Aristaeellaceae bacterium]